MGTMHESTLPPHIPYGGNVEPLVTKHTYSKHTYTKAVAHLGRAEGWLWRAYEAGIEPTDTTMLALAKGFIQAGDVEASRRGLALRERLGRQPSITACVTSAWTYAASGDYGTVEALLSDLREARIQPNSACFRALLAAYARAPRPPKSQAEDCFVHLYRAGGVNAITERVLKDASNAIGSRRLTDLCNSINIFRDKPSLWQTLQQFQHWSSRGRVVGRQVEILPCTEPP